MAAVEKSRIEWMDVLRGTSIILVVFNHAVLFASSSPLGAPDVAWVLNTVFSPVRMPLMVFLSGLLVSASLARGPRAYVTGKVRRVLYPYFVWSVIALALLYGFGIREGVVGGVTTHVVTAWDLLLPLYDPVEHLWFLYDLFLFYMVALVTPRIPPLWIAGGALAAAALVPDFGARRFFLLLVFFMIGVWFSQHVGALDRVLARRWIVWGCAALALATVAAAVAGVGLRYTALSAPFAAGGIGIAIVLARRIGSARMLRPLRAVGRDSLVYYIVHWWPASAGVALGALTGNAWIALATGFVFGLGAGVVMVRLLRVLPALDLLFAWPVRRVGTAASSSGSLSTSDGRPSR